MNEVFILPFIVYVLSKSLTDASHQSSTVPYASFTPPRAAEPATWISWQISKGPSARSRFEQVSTSRSEKTALAQQQHSPHCTTWCSKLQPAEAQPAALPTSNHTYSAAAESTHTVACLNRGQTSRPRTLGAITKTSHALGPRTKQSHSDVVNNSAHTGLREPIAQPLLNLITLESKYMPILPRHCPNWATITNSLQHSNGSVQCVTTHCPGKWQCDHYGRHRRLTSPLMPYEQLYLTALDMQQMFIAAIILVSVSACH